MTIKSTVTRWPSSDFSLFQLQQARSSEASTTRMKSTFVLALLLRPLLSRADEVHSDKVPLGYTSPPVPFVFSSNTGAKQPQNYLDKYGPQSDLSYTGPLSFSHLDYARCLDDPSTSYDIAIFGMPFDTTTSYRAGARFGPHGIRLGSRRQSEKWGHSLAWGMNPYEGVKVMDCGDVRVRSHFPRAILFERGLLKMEKETAY